MPNDLTPDQAIRVARELRGDFDSHRPLLNWRAQRLREPWKDPKIAALGIEPGLKNIVPYQSDIANQEAHRYANAFTTADPEIAVFVRSEKRTEQDIGARLENFYQAALSVLWPDPYPAALHVAGDGFAPLRLDVKQAFWRGIPDRPKDEDAEKFNQRVDDHRRAIGLPVELVTIDPATFFYEENKQREIIMAAEYGECKESAIAEIYDEKSKGEEFLGPVVPEGRGYGQRMVTFVVLRTPTQVMHLLLDGEGRNKSAKDRVLWEGDNLFAPSTGYVLWRGLFSGDTDMSRRYHPFIMNTLNDTEHLNLFMSLQANLAVQEQGYWEERRGQLQDQLPGRQLQAEAKGTTGGKKSTSRAIATMEEGVQVHWREMRQDVDRFLARLEFNIARYGFPEPLAPESSSGESGRDTIRRQEVSARLLRQGFKGRKDAIEKVLHILIRTLFNHRPFLAQGRLIYAPILHEGLGEEGTMRKQELIYIEESDNIPHEVQVTVASMSQAAQAALREEGNRMAGILSQETRDQDFYGVKNIPLENRRRAKDTIRAALYPVAIKRAIENAVARFEGRVPAGSAIVVPDTVPQNGGQAVPGQTQAVSARPTPPQPEDLGLAGEGGPLPAPEA